MKTILIVDDDADEAEILAHGLSCEGRLVRAFSDPMSALSVLEAEVVDVMIADVSMPWMSGCDVACVVRRRWPDCKMFLISGVDKAEMLAAGAGIPFFSKPVALDQLRHAVAAALGERDDHRA